MSTIYDGSARGNQSDILIRANPPERIAEIGALLAKKLGPEYLSNRPGGGGSKLTYIEAWRVLEMANKVFGWDGWFSEIKSLHMNFCDIVPPKASSDGTVRYNIGITAIVRVWTRDGGSHEDVGIGKMENVKSKGEGFDKCSKEAVTDAIKRALRNFGNLMGNCIYDKDYVSNVSKVKAFPPKFEFSSMLRPDYVPVPKPKPVVDSNEGDTIASTSALDGAPIHVPTAIKRAATIATTTVSRTVPIQKNTAAMKKALPWNEPAPPLQNPVDDFDAELDDNFFDEDIVALEEDTGCGDMENDDSGFCGDSLSITPGNEVHHLGKNINPPPPPPRHNNAAAVHPSAITSLAPPPSRSVTAPQAQTLQQRQDAARIRQDMHRRKKAKDAAGGGVASPRTSTQAALPTPVKVKPTVPRGGLRPPQPPVRTNTSAPHQNNALAGALNNGAPSRSIVRSSTVVVAAHLPSLTIGSEAGRIRGTSGMNPHDDIGGFESARSVKRNSDAMVAVDEYDVNFDQREPYRQKFEGSTMRNPLGELEIGREGDVKRFRQQ